MNCMRKNLFITGAITLSLISGCASSSLKSVQIRPELPTDLPPDLKNKFEVKELTYTQQVKSDHSKSASTDLTRQNQSGRTKRKNSKKDLNDRIELVEYENADFE